VIGLWELVMILDRQGLPVSAAARDQGAGLRRRLHPVKDLDLLRTALRRALQAATPRPACHD
jgi:hypothetical protein